MSTGSVCSPPSSSASFHLFSMLDSAAEQMMVHRDFQAAFDTCERGLERLGSMEQEDGRCAEIKAGFCIVGIQALAELNQWRCVLSWVLKLYEHQEKIPAKILQMCILLYSKVGEPAAMQEAARAWLRCPSNSTAPGLRTVAELYLLQVLVPLGRSEEARELIAGSGAFTEDQRRTAMEVLEERERQDREPASNPDSTAGSERPACVVPSQGAVVHKLEAALRLLYRRLLSSSGPFPLRRLFLLAVLLYMLFVRMDPALPSSFMWISKLLQLLKQMWRTMFAPYNQTPA